MVCKTSVSIPLVRDILCFNPCYVGLWSVRFWQWSDISFLHGFNPCYVGLWSVRPCDLVLVRSLWVFQSLLCWIMVCKGRRTDRALRHWHLFQSLLCWIMVCKTTTTSCSNTTAFCFNPCYVGLWSVRVKDKKDRTGESEFQSLLCWIMVCKLRRSVATDRRAQVSILVMLDYGL